MYERCLAIAKKANNMDALFARMHKIAVTHENNGSLEAARSSYEQILQFMRAGGVPPMEIAQFQMVVDQRLRKAAGKSK